MNKKTVVIYGGSAEIECPNSRNFIAVELETFFNKNKDKIEKVLFGGATSGVMGLINEAAVKNGIVIEGYSTEEYRKYDERNGVDINFFPTDELRKNAFIEQGEYFLGINGGLGTIQEILATKEIIAENMLDKKITVSHHFEAFRVMYETMQRDRMISQRDSKII